MKNFGPGGEVNQRLDELDAKTNDLQIQLDAEKLWNLASGVLVLQTDVNGNPSSVSLDGRYLTSIMTREAEDSDAVNVSTARSMAIRYSLVL